ncbi:hypothetical protein KCMC57_64420 (plasmid) [Kitasatospora sp. CMC57]|uniref:Uncharacterized protein n=1 Tax=Kitasatospora sp. CMC57 TaxID=3231513 RepID=A0AB33K3B9_9ACTN
MTDDGEPQQWDEIPEGARRVLDERGRTMVVSSAMVLAGLLSAGLLQHVRSPGALVEVLAPSVPPGAERDRLVFAAGAAAGLWAGQCRARTRWEPAALQRAADDYFAAGWAAMGGLAEQAAAVVPDRPGVGEQR